MNKRNNEVQENGMDRGRKIPIIISVVVLFILVFGGLYYLFAPALMISWAMRHAAPNHEKYTGIDFMQIAYLNNKFVLIGYDNSAWDNYPKIVIYTSKDGEDWHKLDIKFNDEQDKWQLAKWNGTENSFKPNGYIVPSLPNNTKRKFGIGYWDNQCWIIGQISNALVAKDCEHWEFIKTKVDNPESGYIDQVFIGESGIPYATGLTKLYKYIGNNQFKNVGTYLQKGKQASGYDHINYGNGVFLSRVNKKSQYSIDGIVWNGTEINFFNGIYFINNKLTTFTGDRNNYYWVEIALKDNYIEFNPLKKIAKPILVNGVGYYKNNKEYVVVSSEKILIITPISNNRYFQLHVDTKYTYWHDVACSLDKCLIVGDKQIIFKYQDGQLTNQKFNLN